MATRERRVLIGDDEPAARRGVRQLLDAWPEWRVVGECRNGAEVLSAIDTLSPDVIFLDIQMPDIDGFEVVRKRTPERMPALVFLTAYEEFALRGFDAQALDYLVKPVTAARFAQTMERLARHLASHPTGTPEPALLVATARGMVRIDLTEIDWIEAADNYARVWTGQRSFLLRESLQSLEERLGAAGFCRAHRRALIRIGAVRQLVRARESGLVATLRTGRDIPISRRQRAAVVERVSAGR
jgi:two-component system, LytTR family, response regulator